MAHTASTFIVSFPEFSGIDSALITLKLAEAELCIDRVLWATRADAGQGYMAAHLLATSPFGNGTATVQKDGSTRYEKNFARLARIVTGGIRST